jgi:hypothetical protein
MEAFIKYSPPVVFILAAFYFLYKSKNRQRWVNKVGYSMVFVPFAWFYLGIGPFITDYVDALMAEKALAEQMEQGGFVDQGVYYKAQSLNIPTKALYDKHLKEQEEFYARLKEKADARAERAEKRKAELAAAKVELAAKIAEEGYQYTSGRIDTVIFCGTQREGFEIFIAERPRGFKFKLNKISRGRGSATFGMEPEKILALVVPIRNGRPSYDAISRHVSWKHEDHYELWQSSYLNVYDYGGKGDVTKTPPDYKIYRDGSRLEYYFTSQYFGHHRDSAPSSDPLYGCKPITNTSLEELIGERLKGFGKLMEVKWQPLAAEIKAIKDATKF